MTGDGRGTSIWKVSCVFFSPRRFCADRRAEKTGHRQRLQKPSVRQTQRYAANGRHLLLVDSARSRLIFSLRFLSGEQSVLRLCAASERAAPRRGLAAAAARLRAGRTQAQSLHLLAQHQQTDALQEVRRKGNHLASLPSRKCGHFVCLFDEEGNPCTIHLQPPPDTFLLDAKRSLTGPDDSV